MYNITGVRKTIESIEYTIYILGELLLALKLKKRDFCEGSGGKLSSSLRRLASLAQSGGCMQPRSFDTEAVNW